jgi:hypothetical protein
MRKRRATRIGLAPAERWKALVVVTMFVGACGARSELLGPEEDAALDAKPTLDARHEPDVIEEPVIDVVFPDVPIVSDCPDAGATLVYVLGSANQLYSFYPPTLAFTPIGTIGCTSPSSPNSMAVTRSGIAFAGFLNGTLFEVSTANAACKSTTYQPNQDGMLTFGMGYAGDPDGGETLYVAGNGGDGGGQGLASIDTTLFKLDFIAQFQPMQPNCELSGTGSGQLFGFCPLTTGSVLNEIDTSTAQIITSHHLAAGSNAQSFAFAFWGGDFWIFTGNGGSTITEYDPIALTETNVATAPIEIVGAGVSTCAPQ